MILKKPFAFLIKYFKIIHLILLVLTIFITYRFNKITEFFVKYAINNNIVSEGIASSYIPPLIFIAVLIIIIISGFMWYLMYRKEKPSIYYLLMAIYYILILFLTIHAYSLIGALATSTISTKSTRAYRDIYQIFLIPNFYFIIWNLIRSIGFDIKKFNFSKDLEELEIKSEDNEEFEFVLGNDSYKIKRNIRRRLREFTYYFKENKVIISIIIGSISLISIISIF